jgi:hypothetical protein
MHAQGRSSRFAVSIRAGAVIGSPLLTGSMRLLVFCCMFVIHFRAETVALWKLDHEAGDSALNARCLPNPARDLLPSVPYALQREPHTTKNQGDTQ